VRATLCIKLFLELAGVRLVPANLSLLRWPNPLKEVPSGNGSQSPDSTSDVAWDRNTENALTHEACQIA